MSRVTIGKLAGDFNSATFEERQRTKDIEVVPRPMIEKIHKECGEWLEAINNRLPDKVESYTKSDYHAEGRIDALVWVMHMIETELKDFEEGEEA